MNRKAQTSKRKRGAHPTVRMGGGESAGELDIDSLLADVHTQIIVCCGSGGVGKTTTSAALGLRAAESGRKVCVLTIDPARRLAQSMGLSELDNVPRPVEGAGANGGSLDAMMLDMKRTFDEVVEAHATPEKAAQILNNPFYVALSSSFAGTQEYMAMEKLSQLHADSVAGGGTSRWDLIIVDTPPSRSALDFLDAPDRLSALLDGRFIKLLLAPAKGPARLMSMGFGIVTSALNKILGTQFLRDLQTFIAAFDTLFGGFRQRSEETFKLLQADETAFLVVASPERAAMREAAYFVDRLAHENMPLAGVVINRAGHAAAENISQSAAETAAVKLADGSSIDRQVAELLNVHAEKMRIKQRETKLKKQFSSAHPAVSTISVPALASDVHDLDGLREIGRLLAGEPLDQSA